MISEIPVTGLLREHTRKALITTSSRSAQVLYSATFALKGARSSSDCNGPH